METDYSTVKRWFPSIGCDYMYSTDPHVTSMLLSDSLSENPAGTLQIRDAAIKSMMHSSSISSSSSAVGVCDYTVSVPCRLLFEETIRLHCVA